MKESIKKRIEAVRRGEVPEGYAETAAGCIPDDWSSAPLSEISSVLHEHAGDRDFETLSISAGIGFVNQAEKFGKELSGKQYSKYTVLRRGDFAYNKGNSKRYPQGCTYMLRERDEAAVPNVFECFRIAKGHPEYYEQLFINGFMNKQLTQKINHGVRDDGLLNLTDDDFYSTIFPVPPLTEQQKIAEILATCDRVIELKQQLLEEKCRQKQWLMQKLLDPDSGVHLPGFETRMWKEIPLSEVFLYIRNGFVGTATPYYVDDGIPYIEGTNIQNGQWDLSEVLHISEEFHRKHPNSVLRTGDVVVVQSGHVGDCTVVTEKIDGSNSHAIIIMTPTPRVNPYFCACYINSPIGQGRLVGCITGNTVKHILASDMKKYLLPCPEKDEQDALANLFCAAEKEITAIEKEIEAWKQKKKALMQLLLTGLVRVNA